jgi:DNA repair exonuclease SbcCD nuclease subunit
MKFLHTADWQIGMRATALGEKGERVRSARLESARSVVEVAKREHVDFLVVAGDVFEHNGVERIKVREVAKILGAAGCPVFIIPGNHDRLTAGSVWEDATWAEWPNIRILIRPEPVECAPVTVYPCPVSAGDSRDDPTSWIKAKGDSIAVGIAHGSVENAAYDQTLPIPRDAAALRGLDYLALGHYHSSTQYKDEADSVRMAYCGTHEPTAFGEPDSGNVLVVEISERGAVPRIEVVRTASLEWLTRATKVESPGQIQALAAELDALPKPETMLVQCTLTGTLFGADHEALSRCLEIVDGRFLFGRADVSQLTADEIGAEWIERLPEGYLRDAARDLLASAAAEPPDLVAGAALREYSRLWQEVNR